MNFKLAAAVYDYPSELEFVPSLRDEYGDLLPVNKQPSVTAPSFRYANPPQGFLDRLGVDFLPRVMLGDCTEFVASPTIDGSGGSWVLRWRFDPDSPCDQQIVRGFDPGGFWIWQMKPESSPLDLPAAAGILGSSQPTPTSFEAALATSLATPDYVAYGGGGIIETSDVTYMDTGEGLLEARGLGWGHLLDRCVHHSYDATIERPAIEDGAAAPNDERSQKTLFGLTLRAALFNLFWHNSEVDSESTLNPQPSQIGRYLMRLHVTQAAIDAAWSALSPSGLIRIQSGTHSVLDTMQRLAARLGWWMHSGYLEFYVDAIASEPIGDWYRGKHWSSATVSRRMPTATLYTSEHEDAKFDGSSEERAAIKVTYRPADEMLGYSLTSQLPAAFALDKLPETTKNEQMLKWGILERKIPSPAPKYRSYITQQDIDDADTSTAEARERKRLLQEDFDAQRI